MKKLFTNDRFFLLTIAAAVITEIITAILVSVPSMGINDASAAFFMLTLVCCELVLYISYKEHAKNVMKGVMGAMLMAMFVGGQHYISSTGYERVLGCIYCFGLCLLLINHFVINAEHKAKPGHIKLNQVIAVMVVLCDLVWIIIDIVNNPSVILVDIVDLLSIAATLASVVCVESRLDSYRQDRQAAGWTEEEGYPEDYDRTKNYG